MTRGEASERGGARSRFLPRIPLAARMMRPGRSRALLAQAAFALAVFLVVLLYTLPHDRIATRILEAVTAGAPVRVDFREVGFAFPNGYRFHGLRITPLRAPASAFTLDELTVRTSLFGLLLARPHSATLSGDAFGGTLSGAVEQRGARAALDLDLADIDLTRALGPIVPPPGRVAGRAQVRLALAGDPRSTQSAEGDLALTVRGLELHEVAARGITIPDLAFPDLVASAQVAGSRLQVKELRASGDALSLGGTGEMLLRDPLPSSVLNLRLSIDVAPSAPPALRMLTALLPRRTGTDKPVYSLTGTLASPALK